MIRFFNNMHIVHRALLQICAYQAGGFGWLSAEATGSRSQNQPTTAPSRGIYTSVCE